MMSTRLKTSSSHRHITDDAGRSFFYLADTAWELLHRLDFNQADHYLQVRAEQKFNVIQTVALAENAGLTVPNANGDLPLLELDPRQPNEAYFAFVDRVIDRAASLGLYTALLPTWGDKVTPGSGAGPRIFDEENAAHYGRWIGRRYRDQPMIWIIGGDRPVTDESERRIWRAMAEGVRAGDGGRGLMTFHPNGGFSSGDMMHGERWLDFNMLQSGHTGRDLPNWEMIAADLRRTPPKPTLDGEPNYEDHPVMQVVCGKWLPVQGDQWFDDVDIRKAAYRSVFSGACGFTYGCHAVWQMFDPAKGPPINHARTPWPAAMHLAGAEQMRHVRAIFDRYGPFDPLEKASCTSALPETIAAMVSVPPHVFACRSSVGNHTLIYTTAAGRNSVRELLRNTAPECSQSLFDPRTGEITTSTDAIYSPQGREKDWVVVLEHSRDSCKR